MKRTGILAVVLAALAAGFLGSVIKDTVFEARTADAQDTSKPLKVALLDLEAAARSSKKFKDLKAEWELRQNGLKTENRQLQQDIEDKKVALRRAMSRTDGAEEAANLRVELTALDETVKSTREVQKRYLSELLEQYQKEVIEYVLSFAENYCIREGYHLVLQNYDTSTGEGDLFAGGSFSERILNKPVLFAPGVKSKKNPYVTDITAQIVAQVQLGGEPPKVKDD